MILKIYSERNTGSNYLMKLLRKNIEVVEVNGSAITVSPANLSLSLSKLGEIGWKHRLVTQDFLQHKKIKREDIVIVTLTKNPYSWLLSLHKRPYSPIRLRAGVRVRKANGQSRKLFLQEFLARIASCFGGRINLFLSQYPRWCFYKKLSFHDFIRVKWFSEFHEGRDEGFSNAIQLWNAKNKAYLDLAKHYNVILLTYEELLASPEVTLRKVLDKLSYTVRDFSNEHAPVKEKDKNTSKNYDYYQDYYLNERWRDKLNKEDIAWISSQLDPEVMKAYGYKYL